MASVRFPVTGELISRPSFHPALQHDIYICGGPCHHGEGWGGKGRGERAEEKKGWGGRGKVERGRGKWEEGKGEEGGEGEGSRREKGRRRKGEEGRR